MLNRTKFAAAAATALLLAACNSQSGTSEANNTADAGNETVNTADAANAGEGLIPGDNTLGNVAGAAGNVAEDAANAVGNAADAVGDTVSNATAGGNSQ